MRGGTLLDDFGEVEFRERPLAGYGQGDCHACRCAAVVLPAGEGEVAGVKHRNLSMQILPGG